MIRFTFIKNKSGRTVGFRCTNHGRDIVCAAVSALTMNAINSIEVFGKCEFSLDFNEEGGFLEFMLEEGEEASDSAKRKDSLDPVALLLLDCLDLGICNIAAEYEEDIEVFVEEVYDA